jgi:ABC-type branched-subunit amino acid transport system ATPase component
VTKATAIKQFVVYRKAAPQIDENASFPLIALFRDNWNDYGFNTLFSAHVYTAPDEAILLGHVKIACGTRGFQPEVPSSFAALPDECFSLGQSVGFYRSVGQLDPSLGRAVLTALHDVVAAPELLPHVRELPVFEKSFLRSYSADYALRRGGFYIGSQFEEVAPPRFALEMRISSTGQPHVLDVDFHADPQLPRRVILLIGKNGTGKTTALATLAYALCPGPGVFDPDSVAAVAAKYEIRGIEQSQSSTTISQVIAVSYNAFDDFPLPASQKARMGTYRSRLNYKYCGLKNMAGDPDEAQIALMWRKSLEPIRDKDRIFSLNQTLSKLIGTDLAAELVGTDDEVRKACFKKLSAGQRITVSIFGDIIASVEQGSLVLIDEPETHLHPGLLHNAFFALSDLLAEYDSHAIVATHSPIILQNVPSSFVRIFRRGDNATPVSGPRGETFGEDLGELFRQDLGLGDPDRDFTEVLRALFDRHGSSKAVEALFEKPLGLPARAFLLSLEAR